MADATISVTACDNELYLIAYVAKDLSRSYQICHIQSGYSWSVNVDITLAPGVWQRPATYDGLSGPINAAPTVCLPAGDYYLIAAGIDGGIPVTGGLGVFDVTLNSTPLPGSPYNDGKATPGVCWHPEAQLFNVS